MNEKAGIGFKIRRRERILSSPPEGLRQNWTEYQVVAGRKIAGRFDLLEQALKEYPGAELDISVTHSDVVNKKRVVKS